MEGSQSTDDNRRDFGLELFQIQLLLPAAGQCSRTAFAVGSGLARTARVLAAREHPPRHPDHPAVLADLDPELHGPAIMQASGERRERKRFRPSRGPNRPRGAQ
jgi:hypothetical protein